MQGKARVTAVERGHYEVHLEGEERKRKRAVVRGRFHELEKNELPKVGDWVSVSEREEDTVQIEAVVPRRNEVKRLLSFDGTLQVLVTNVDMIAIVMGCDNDFNIKRLQRYLALAEDANAEPLVVLSKADLEPERLDSKVAQVKAVCPQCTVLPLSTVTRVGIEAFMTALKASTTTVLLGSSGVGKSSLTNVLLEADVAATGTVRQSDERGRHTTRKRQMYILKNGAAIIDTPGIRELALESAEETAASAYPDIEALALQCRFRDCDHEKSAGCALQAAVASGKVAEADVAAYLKLKTRQQRHRRTRSIRR